MLNCSVVSNSLQPHGLCNLPGSSVHKIFQATILDVLSFPTPGDLPNQWTKHSSLAFPSPVGGFFYHCVIWKPINVHILAVIMQQNTMEVYRLKDFPGISAGKESACNSGDPGLISGSGRTPGEGIGYALQYSWASLVAHMVKNPLAMSSIPRLGRSPGWGHGNPLQYSSILAWRIPMDRGAWWATANGVSKSWTQLSN